MSGWFLSGKEGLLARTTPEAAGVFVVGVNEDYVYDEEATDFTGITPHIILPEKQLLNVSFTGGTLKADNLKWLAAGAGVVDISLVLAGIVIYFQLEDTGELLAFIDQAATGLPSALTGVDVSTLWDARGILKL